MLQNTVTATPISANFVRFSHSPPPEINAKSAKYAKEEKARLDPKLDPCCALVAPDDFGSVLKVSPVKSSPFLLVTSSVVTRHPSLAIFAFFAFPSFWGGVQNGPWLQIPS